MMRQSSQNPGGMMMFLAALVVASPLLLLPLLLRTTTVTSTTAFAPIPTVPWRTNNAIGARCLTKDVQCHTISLLDRRENDKRSSLLNDQQPHRSIHRHRRRRHHHYQYVFFAQVNEEQDLSETSSSIPDIEISQEEAEFLSRTKQLCEERNLPFQCVKNARDLSSVKHSPVQPGRVYRMGRVSDATTNDIELLFDEMNLKTLVDLRSPTELKDDGTLEREEVFGNFTSMVWYERGHNKDGCVRELDVGRPRIKPKKHRNRGNNKKKTKIDAESKGTNVNNEEKKIYRRARDIVKGIKAGVHAAFPHPDDDDVAAAEKNDATQVTISEASSSSSSPSSSVPSSEKEEEEDEIMFKEVVKAAMEGASDDDDECNECVPLPKLDQDTVRKNRRERHFVSLMNEFKYVRGTLSKLRKRDIARVIMKSPGALVSRRVRNKVKDTFLDEINDGGLPMLNELLLRFGAPGIKYTLDLVADKSRHPIAFYCTAGKDRTGMIAAIILSVLGVPDEDIVEDYSLSANVYAEMNDHKAMVGALSQRNLDPKTFLGAPPQVMRDTLESIRENYGSVEGYLDWIGFDAASREKLKAALLL